MPMPARSNVICCAVSKNENAGCRDDLHLMCPSFWALRTSTEAVRTCFRVSARLVAATTMTPLLPSKPSISVRIWFLGYGLGKASKLGSCQPASSVSISKAFGLGLQCYSSNAGYTNCRIVCVCVCVCVRVMLMLKSLCHHSRAFKLQTRSMGE